MKKNHKGVKKMKSFLGVRPSEPVEIDAQTGDYLFRFPVESPPHIPSDHLFRWVVEEQLRALLDLVEFADGDRPCKVTSYRFLSEKDFRLIFPQKREDD